MIINWEFLWKEKNDLPGVFPNAIGMHVVAWEWSN